MKLRYYTDKELNELNSNMFVIDILHKRTIVYDPIFKLWCIMMRLKFPELTAKQIFKRAGFNTAIFNDNLPYRRIGEWLKNYNKYGINYFLPEDEAYHTLSSESIDYEKDSFKVQLLKIVLNELKDIRKKSLNEN